jgi:hypothetical protein
VYFIIDAVPCNSSDCHGHEMNGLHLVGTADDMYEALLNTVSEPCENLPIVDPGNPEGSALVKLLNGPCGKLPHMPAGCSTEQGNCLADKYLKAVEDWITAGAPR